MRVMVTGGTGYVGAWSVKALVDAGHKVRLLVRDPAKARTMFAALGLPRLPCVTGDMTDEVAVLKALQGCDAVLHCAAVVSTDPRRADEMMAANPRGVELVIGHAVRLGLDPVVHVSSVAALLRPGMTEQLKADLPLGTLDSGYARSKAAAERCVRDLQDKGAPIVITYPGSVTGPAAGRGISEATEGLAQTVAMGSLPSPDAAWSIIDGRDLGAVHAALMVPGLGPRRFMCGGTYLVPADLSATLERITGRSFKVLPMSGALLRGIGWAADAVGRVFPIESVLSHEAMVCFTQMPPSDDLPVRRELGVRYRKIDVTLREALLAARDAGLLTEKQVGKLAKKQAPR